MSDLSLKAAHNYWKQYQDPMIYRVLCWMESAETSKEKNTLFEIMLKELGKTLERSGNVDFNQLEERDTLISLSNHLNMTQTLHLLQVLDTAQPGAAAKLLMYAENTTKSSSDDAGIFLQRNLVFERLRLLSRVFATDRLELVYEALTAEIER